MGKTVRQPVARIGALAVDVVLAQARGEARSMRQVIEPELIVRESSGAAVNMRTRELLTDLTDANPLRPPQSLAEHGRKERARLATLPTPELNR